MKPWLIGLAALVLVACGRQPYAGYDRVAPGLYIRLISFDRDAPIGNTCAVVEANISTSDSLSNLELLPLQSDLLPFWYRSNAAATAKIQRYLEHLQPGDSAVFIDLRPEVSSLADSAIVHIGFRHCYTEEQFAVRYNNWLERREFTEPQVVEGYAMRHGFTPSIVHPDVFFRTEASGVGQRLVYGDPISIHYSGHFLNGRLFDDSRRNGQPLTFELGREGQVLKGLEFGLIGMEEGEVRSILIPSVFAFGEKGSSTGIVPPYTPLLYRVEALVPDSIS